MIGETIGDFSGRLMAKAIVEKQVCVNCGADVRPDTEFCYNCGKSVAAKVTEDGNKNEVSSAEPNESLVDLEKALAASRPVAGDSKSKREAAAAERRRARVGKRKPIEIAWEPPGMGANRIYLLVVLLIFVLVLATVFLTVFSK